MLGLLQKKCPSDKIKAIKSTIKNGTYDMDSAIKDVAGKIVNYPQSLLWK